MTDTSKAVFKFMPFYQQMIIREMGITTKKLNSHEIRVRESIYLSKMTEAIKQYQSDNEESEESETDTDSHNHIQTFLKKLLKSDN
jgi:hypothetical protein